MNLTLSSFLQFQVRQARANAACLSSSYEVTFWGFVSNDLAANSKCSTVHTYKGDYTMVVIPKSHREREEEDWGPPKIKHLRFSYVCLFISFCCCLFPKYWASLPKQLFFHFPWNSHHHAFHLAREPNRQHTQGNIYENCFKTILGLIHVNMLTNALLIN